MPTEPRLAFVQVEESWLSIKHMVTLGLYGREQLGKPLVDEIMVISALSQC